MQLGYPPVDNPHALYRDRQLPLRSLIASFVMHSLALRTTSLGIRGSLVRNMMELDVTKRRETTLPARNISTGTPRYARTRAADAE
jgi:hypothetical protein